MAGTIRVNFKILIQSFIFLTGLLALNIVEASSAQYELTVVNGSGSGFYEEGQTVVICAGPSDNISADNPSVEPLDPDLPVRIFSAWSGNTESVDKISGAKTFLTMPARDCVVTANFIDQDRWAPPRVYPFIPENPRGIVFFFHGLASSATNLISREGTREFIGQTVAEGYGVLVVDAYNRETCEWDLEPSASDNIDTQRIISLRRSFIDKGKISEDDPIYLAGISNGGLFASLLANQSILSEVNLPVKATALFVSKLLEGVVSTTTVPTIYVLAENDNLLDLDRAMDNFSDLLARGIPAQLLVQRSMPLHPNEFTRTDGITIADSQTIYAALESVGYVDDQGWLTQAALALDRQDVLLAVLPSDLDRYVMSIDSHLYKANADHAFYNDFSDRIFNFFENPSTLVEDLPQIFDFDPQTGAGSSLVTLTGENFVAVDSVRFNGFEAEFNVIDASKIVAVVPASAGTGPITVTNAAGTVTSLTDFVTIGEPVINQFYPTSGPAGTIVSVEGTGFSQIKAVYLGFSQIGFSIDSDTRIEFTVPQEAASGKITIFTSAGRITSSDRFKVTKN